jgi:predicted phosphodiesterase
MTTFIGDVHGKYGAYKSILKQHQNTIQVGDMGVGFRRSQSQAEYMDLNPYYPNPPYDLMVSSGARFIRGNHDNPDVCKRHKRWIPDGTVEGDMMFVGGAYSIDMQYRTEGLDWWADEELSQSEFYQIMDIYEAAKPRVMVTHDCPEFLVGYIHSHHFGISTKTGQALDAMFGLHKPEVWVFGHHHKSFDQEIKGTRFVCVAELEVKEID